MQLLPLVIVAAAAFVRNPPRSSFAPLSSRPSLSDILDYTDFQSFFRLTQSEYKLIHAALNLPAIIETDTRDKVPSEIALLLLLGFLGDARLPTLSRAFGRSESACSRICTAITNEIHTSWAHLLDIRRSHTNLLRPSRLRLYADVMVAQECPLDNLWGFIDGTVRPTARPIRGQKEYYSGHKRHHGHKYQIVITPDGMMWAYGPVSARRNDSFVLQDSELHQWLDAHSQDISGTALLLYGDKGYAARGHLVVPHKGLFLTPAQDKFNLQLSRVRIAVEWAIGSVPTLFPRLDVKRAQRMLLSDLPSQYRVAVLLRNALSCVSSNQTSQTFQCPTPTLSQYFVPLQS
ncbi:hypothetical protein CF319_g3358 [Tilletia indica]|nr:hypothetical protein CF319_g3358 [Tilletia indica]KAE8232535.1 hypothetical protein CF326_g2438 [Tilletia indica]